MERLRKYTTVFYSTHILSDVQRVSDTVAILNKGMLVAEAPIAQLLAGGSAGVAYELSLRSASAQALAAAQARIAEQPWVTAVDMTPDGGQGEAHWHVSVSEADPAEENLLRLVLEDRQVRVTAFGLRRYDLEEVFLNLVEGNNDGD
jgi:ABC-2 type transport system ATP-binding protein